MVQYTCYKGIILRTRSACLNLHLVLKLLGNYQISCMQFKIRVERNNDLFLPCFIISAFPLPFSSTAIVSFFFLSTFLFFFLFPFLLLCVSSSLFSEISLQVSVPLTFWGFCIWHPSVLRANIWNNVCILSCSIILYPTAFPYGNGMVLHFYQQQESSTTKTVHKVINKGLKAYV